MKDALSLVIAHSIWRGLCCFCIFFAVVAVVVIGIFAAILFLPLIVIGGICYGILRLVRCLSTTLHMQQKQN